MKNLIFFFLLIVLLFEQSLAQTEYPSGYIITKSDETIYGLIDYDLSLKNLNKCRFKPNNEDHFTEYSPNDIKAFRFDDSYYFVALPINEKGIENTYFVELLIDGVVDVYSYFKDKKNHYLISDEKGELHELKNTEVQIENDGKVYIKRQKEYVGALKYLFRESPATLNRLKSLSLDKNSLIKTAEYYHNDVCSEYECLVYAKNKHFPKITYGFFTGYTTSTISFSGNKYIKGLNSDFSKGNSLTFGMMLNIMDPYISNKFSFQVEAMFSRANYSTDSSGINIKYLKLPFLLKYTIAPSKRIKPSFQLGFSYNKWRSFEDEGMVPKKQNRSAIQERQHQIGLITGIELSYKLTKKMNLFIQGRYENYGGKHWNHWTLVDGGGNPSEYSEIVKSKTNFLSITTGLSF
ncbi:porin family protein [Flexithrix dorotheae]|uniref:porin family protein n=1 Tax=Flexithrix dorotheae TaxID=70993 RepID=UPI00035E5B77|nr:porin family protein [Flexithrix dorotheae]